MHNVLAALQRQNVKPLVLVGGVLFKVYVVGDAIKVVRRFSLPDVSKRELSKSAGVYRFPRVSCAAASADDADLEPCVAGKAILFVTHLFSLPPKICLYT